MAHGDFIWCDLSAYDPPRAMRFYSDVLNWRWSGADETGTYLASAASAPVASLYQMPERFMAMGMPSFWMSYIAVDNAAASVERARNLGGKIEIGPDELPGRGRCALIRDPLGAGFTILESEPGAKPGVAAGQRAGHGLFVSDLSAIKQFYETSWMFFEHTHDRRVGGRTSRVRTLDDPLHLVGYPVHRLYRHGSRYR